NTRDFTGASRMVASCGSAFNDSIHRCAIRCMRAGDHYQSGRHSGSSERVPSGGCHMEERLVMARRHEMKFWERTNRYLWMSVAMLLVCGLAAFAQAPAAAPPAQAVAAPTSAQATPAPAAVPAAAAPAIDRKSTRLNSSHEWI